MLEAINMDEVYGCKKCEKSKESCAKEMMRQMKPLASIPTPEYIYM